MSIFRTTDHDEIRGWIEEHDGEPAIIRGTTQTDEGVLTIAFGDLTPDMRHISWDEFFDMFERNNLRFRYDDEPDEDAGWSFSFENRDEPTTDTEDETELPETFDEVDQDVEENMFPSAE